MDLIIQTSEITLLAFIFLDFFHKKAELKLSLPDAILKVLKRARNSGNETVHSGINSDLPSRSNRLELFPYDRT